MRQSGWARTLVGAMAIGLVVAACSADDDSRDRDSTEADEAAPGIGGLGDDVPSGQPMTVEPQLEEGERAIVYTANLGVHVEDVQQATDEAVTVVEAVGGHLSSRNSDYEEDEPTTDLTLKVPPDDLNDVLGQLEGLGETYRHNLESQDVTEEMVDLQGRLSSAEASAERLREMLTGADTPSDLVEIEGTLTEREANVESLQGQMSALSGQVEMATIDLRLTESSQPSDAEVSDDIPGFVTALRTGSVALVNVVLVLLMIVGFLLPFSPFAAGAWWGYRTYRRNHPPRRPAGPIPATAGGLSPAPSTGTGTGTEDHRESTDTEPGKEPPWRAPGRTTE